MKTRIVDKKLVAWLKKQGASEDVISCFVLEKGMGERMELGILDSATVELAWYGQPRERGAKRKRTADGSGRGE